MLNIHCQTTTLLTPISAWSNVAHPPMFSTFMFFKLSPRITFPHTLHILVLWQLLDIMELCTHPIPVQKEDIKPILSFYTKLLRSDWSSDVTLFCNITLFGNDGVNRINYKSKSLPLQFTFLQESHYLLLLICLPF